MSLTDKQHAVHWQELAQESHYHTAVAIRDVLQEGKVDDATAGLEELIDALSRSERRALESHLKRLMRHVIIIKARRLAIPSCRFGQSLYLLFYGCELCFASFTTILPCQGNHLFE